VAAQKHVTVKPTLSTLTVKQRKFSVPPQVKQGTVIFRHWDTTAGMNEIARRFSNLDELFALCLQRDQSLLVERIIIDGKDEANRARTVILTFQSVTIANSAES